jgi:hypothetical protein
MTNRGQQQSEPNGSKVILYHYTAPTTSHLGAILAEGQIRTTESNISFAQTHAGPDVIWLTDSDDPDRQSWVGDVPLKSRAVLIVELPIERVHHWPAWSREHEIDQLAYDGLAATGGDPDSWWVTMRPIQKWHIKALVIAPFRMGPERFEHRELVGDELSRLFRSAGARKQLPLPTTRATRA